MPSRARAGWRELGRSVSGRIVFAELVNDAPDDEKSKKVKFTETGDVIFDHQRE